MNKQGKLHILYFAKFNSKWINEDELCGWSKNLFPSKELLNNYKYNKISYEEYEKRFFNEIENSKDAQQDISSICAELKNGNDITLYCHEQILDNCHRNLLIEIFKEKGFEVSKIE